MNDEVALRLATLDDVPAISALRANAFGGDLVTAESMLLWMSTVPEDAHLLLLAAEVDGQIVGHGKANRYYTGTEPDAGNIDVIVAPDHQGKGVGTRIATQCLDHMAAIGVRTIHTYSVDGPAQRAIGARFGFVEMHASSKSSVDPRTVEPLPLPEGVTIRSFGEVGDPYPLYELAQETYGDIPGEGDFFSETFTHWTAKYWHTVFADDDASLAAYVDGELAAMTIIRVDRASRRAQNNLTATRRAFRGRGLAQLLKSHSLHRAAQAGATAAFTGNDEKNAPMLAVNRKLGYRHMSRRIQWERRQADS